MVRTGIIENEKKGSLESKEKKKDLRVKRQLHFKIIEYRVNWE
jgi:hypothetical protein